YPLRVERYELIADSGGAGEHRGGLGLVREVRYLSDEGYFTNRSDGQKFPPLGVLGGSAGATSQHRLIRASGRVEELPSKVTNLTIQAGDLIIMETAGGGGNGPAAARDPAAVLADVLDGKVTTAAARDDYGVAVDPVQGTIEQTATDRLRAVRD
ncbi:MAG: hydantoinase B/oxoprolinase family protein, partial [Alphaproteobacteria bacterium]|nr:hydantoinase B/oxoprolinase family protein [Alphaproteobacteria bacterium]